MEVEQHFPTMDYSKVEVRYISQERGGLGSRFEVKMRNKTEWYPLFYTKKDANGEYVLRKDLTQEIKKALGPYKTNPELVQQLDQNTEDDTKVADDENEQPEVRDRARKRITENTRLRDKAEQEREQIEERLPLRERLKNLFKKHGFNIATVVTAVGITIGVLTKILADGASAAANGIKTVGKKVGAGLKELDKRIGAILSRPAWWAQSPASRGWSGDLISCQKRLEAYPCCGGLHDPKTHREEARIGSLLSSPR